MATKIFAQVIIKPKNKSIDKKSLAKGSRNVFDPQPSKVQLKKAEKRLVEAGCEITSFGPTIGISMEVSEFDVLFSTNFSSNSTGNYDQNAIIIPEKLKDIIKDVAIATFPDYFK